MTVVVSNALGRMCSIDSQAMYHIDTAVGAMTFQHSHNPSE